MDALHRCLRVAHEVGVVAVLVDAKDDQAKRFYARYEFEYIARPTAPALVADAGGQPVVRRDE